MILRPYQEAAVNAVYEHLRTRDDNPVVVCPTGAGKSLLIAQIAGDAVRRWNGRVVVLAHVQELLEQNADKIRRLCGDVQVGIYSAGLKRRDTESPIICAGIQSVYKRACELDAFDLAIIDECHLLTPKGDGMYRQFLADAELVNPNLRLIGMTATPFRMKTGPICTPDGFLNDVCYEIGVRELIRDGYLCPLVTKAGKTKADTSGLHVRGGEFVADEVENLMDRDDLVRAACAEIVELTRDRKSRLIFASGVRHCEHIASVLTDEHGVECGFVTGATPAPQREQLLTRFRAGDLPYLVNVNVLTTGFDAPNIDCIAMLRPTLSPGLFAQTAGRGFRVHPGKQDCLVLDFGGNVLRHGPVDDIRVATRTCGNGQAPAKECPQCQALIAAGFARCPACGYPFPPPDRQQHSGQASEAGILSGQVTDTEYVVRDIDYSVHAKRDAPPDAPKTMRVAYRLGLNYWQSEWVCFEHSGYARQKAVAWWRRRSPDAVPDTAAQAVEIAGAGGVAFTEKVKVRSIAGEKYDRIIGYTLGPMPEPLSIDTDQYDDQVPF